MTNKSRKKGGGLSKLRFSTNLVQHGNFDLIFACTVLLLFTFGIIMMYSASYAYSASNRGGANALFYSQLENAVIGFIGLAVLSKLDYKIYNGRFALLAYGLTMAVLLITLAVNIGKDEKRWIEIGNFQLQPSEFAKFSLILVLAYVLCALQKPLRAPKGAVAKFDPKSDGLTGLETRVFGFARTPFKACFVVACIIVSYCGLIFLESHYSCTILMFAMGVFMLWLSGTRVKYFAWLGLAIAAVVTVVLMYPQILESLGGFGASRISAWLEKDNSSWDRYQTVNGLYAIGSGGLFGVGLGNSKQKQLYIPEPQNDFIFPVICEELGFVGAVLVILLFAVLIWRGFIIARKSRDYFGSLVVMGIMIQVALQVIINICVVTDIFPNTGIALPFFSYGGTALIVLLCEMGVVLSVSREASMEKK
ncbi:MAG: FtsW/RodA/SpoVE family cell cycle protein [Clostridia bacterium]|nr:FtsW/RodA/SpoVE family cell cycle protein [Clostridia bacterium]